MSYISDWLHSEQTEDDYITYHNAAVRDNARDRWEREHEYDDYEDTEQIKEEVCDRLCRYP